MLWLMQKACFLLYIVFLKVNDLIFPDVSMSGQTLHVLGFGHSLIIFPALPGVGLEIGICVCTRRSFKRVFLLKPSTSLDS